MDRKAVGKKIQAYREVAGLSQEQLAEKIGLSTIFVSAIECGIRSPSLETFVKICNVLGASADVLLSDLLANGYRVKASQFSELIENLSAEEQKQIFTILDKLLLCSLV